MGLNFSFSNGLDLAFGIFFPIRSPLNTILLKNTIIFCLFVCCTIISVYECLYLCARVCVCGKVTLGKVRDFGKLPVTNTRNSNKQQFQGVSNLSQSRIRHRKPLNIVLMLFSSQSKESCKFHQARTDYLMCLKLRVRHKLWEKVLSQWENYLRLYEWLNNSVQIENLDIVIQLQNLHCFIWFSFSVLLTIHHPVRDLQIQISVSTIAEKCLYL